MKYFNNPPSDLAIIVQEIFGKLKRKKDPQQTITDWKKKETDLTHLAIHLAKIAYREF